jgi:hypothetical protein
MYNMCPYCRKRVRDMPSHLEHNKKCGDRHAKKLYNEFISVCRINTRRLTNSKED